MQSAGTSDEPRGGSTVTVVLALASNVAVGVLKLVAGLITGSSSMLAEAAHSVADTGTEIFLLTALRRSGHRADRYHPFGYGKERFAWAMLAAVSVFVTGATFSIYEGVSTIVSGGEEQTTPWVAYAVIVVSMLIEGTSWRQSLRQIQAERRALRLSLRRYLLLSDDPTVKSVFFEDSAALLGLAIALAGVGLHQLTGSSVYDGAGSIAIGLLLAWVAFLLGRTNLRLLIGRQAEPRVLRAMFDHLSDAPEVDQVVDLQTMLTATDSVLVCARLDFADGLSSADLERACLRLDDELHERFGDVDQVFLEPVPRTDPDVRADVMARYGDVFSQWRREREQRA